MLYKITSSTLVKKVVELPIEPCFKCGGHEIKFHDCGYSSFNVCSMTCKCGRKVKRMGDYTEQEMLEEWNKNNGKLSDARKLEILRAQLRYHGQEPEV